MRPVEPAAPVEAIPAVDDFPVHAPLGAREPAERFAPFDLPRPDDPSEGVAPSVKDLDLRASTPTLLAEPEPIRVFEPSRSAVWPLMLALVVGLSIGFAGGYGFGVREHLATPAGVAAGRESSEVAVSAAPAPGSEPGRGATTAAPRPPAAAPTPAPAAKDTTRPVAVRAIEAPTSPGSLLVQTTPPGAHVIIDGRDAGRSPLAVRDLASGVHRLRLQREGFISEDRRVTITRSRPAQTMTVVLERPKTASPAPAASARTTGLLSVDSLPPGANVFLDGRLLGTTPMAATPVPSGDHAIRLERDGFRGWVSSVHVVATEQSRVTASLER